MAPSMMAAPINPPPAMVVPPPPQQPRYLAQVVQMKSQKKFRNQLHTKLDFWVFFLLNSFQMHFFRIFRLWSKNLSLTYRIIIRPTTN
jgi:hypothetical protein